MGRGDDEEELERELSSSMPLESQFPLQVLVFNALLSIGCRVPPFMHCGRDIAHAHGSSSLWPIQTARQRIKNIVMERISERQCAM